MKNLASASGVFRLCIAVCLFASASIGAEWVLIGWNDLGMHCMDGSDYSVFSVLPPYNTVYAHLIHQGVLVTNTAGITVTYEAVADPDGSINRSSKDKINFWQYVNTLYGVNPPPDTGIAGFAMPGPANTPQEMHFTNDYYVAEGVPVFSIDDATNRNSYPLMRLIARQGTVELAHTDVVLPVSDEMNCRVCHGSGAGPAAEPAVGWAWDCAIEKDVKFNILQFHDEKNLGNPVYTNLLALGQYLPGGIYATSTNGTPILCGRCHRSNALPGTGLPGAPDLTFAMHGLHANVVDPDTGLTMDSSTNRAACYRCHPGINTRCLRGAMGKAIADDGSMLIQCQNCHGQISNVADTNRTGWLTLPMCQSCHTGPATHNNGQIRYDDAFVASNVWRTAVDQLFASNPDVPLPGFNLYRFSRGHSDLYCENCHNSTHAETPTSVRNDNIQAINVQGHDGKIADCLACHVTMPNTVNGGPHGMHPASAQWGNSGHKDPGDTPSNCQPCHGLNQRGTVLSHTFAARTINAFGTKRFWQGQEITCFTCHNGSGNTSSSTNPPPIVYQVATVATAGMNVTFPLQARDPNGTNLILRIVSQPAHGTVGVKGTNATFFADPTFIGGDIFTYAASDGWQDSNLATGIVSILQGQCIISLVATAAPSALVAAEAPFWAAATVSGCSNPAVFTWDFGDTTTNEARQNACHAFNSAGIYTWTVTVQVGATNVSRSGSVTVLVPEPALAVIGVACVVLMRRRRT